MNYEQIEKLIDKVNKSKITELSVEEGNFKLNIKAEQNVAVSAPTEFSNGINANNANADISNNEEVSDNLEEIKSPLVGTFYAARAEGEEPLIKVGDKIKKGQTIGIIEAMKLMNEISATCDGVVEEILVHNEELVEYGQVIVKVSK